MIHNRMTHGLRDCDLLSLRKLSKLPVSAMMPRFFFVFCATIDGTRNAQHNLLFWVTFTESSNRPKKEEKQAAYNERDAMRRFRKSE